MLNVHILTSVNSVVCLKTFANKALIRLSMKYFTMFHKIICVIYLLIATFKVSHIKHHWSMYFALVSHCNLNFTRCSHRYILRILRIDKPHVIYSESLTLIMKSLLHSGDPVKNLYGISHGKLHPDLWAWLCQFGSTSGILFHHKSLSLLLSDHRKWLNSKLQKLYWY